MARNCDNEVLIPIDVIVARTGYPTEGVWRRLSTGDVRRDWDGGYAVTWSRASELYVELRAALEESDRRNAAMREAQERELAQELERHQREAAECVAREPRRVLQGTEVSYPGDPVPDWMGVASKVDQ